MSLISLNLPDPPAKSKPVSQPRVQQVQFKRYWNAASVNRLTADWRTTILSPNLELWTDLRKLRGRSRDLVRNNAFAAAFVKLFVRNVVGPRGVRLQSKVKNLRGGDLRESLNSQIESDFSLWGQRKLCSADRKLNWLGFQHLVAKTWAVDGECFIWKKRVPASVNPFGLQFMLIDCDQVDYTLFSGVDSGTGNQIVMGIEITPEYQVVAYHVFSKHPSDWSAMPTTRMRIPAADVIHLYIPHRPNALRAAPMMAPAMLSLQMLGGYTEAELVAARTASSKLGFITTEAGDDGFTGESVPGKPDGAGANPDGTLKMTGEPGTIEQLEPGQNFAGWDPTHPTSAFSYFVKTVLRAVASGMGVSYNSLANDLEGVNFSSIRAGLLDERDEWRVLQSAFKDDFCQPVMDEWLGMQMLLDRLNLGGIPFDNVAGAMQWHARSWPWVDPFKDAQASSLEVQNGFNSRTRILAERGLDFDEITDELAAEQKTIEAKGLTLGTDTKGVADTASDDQKDPGAAEETAEDESADVKPAAKGSAKKKSKSSS